MATGISTRLTAAADGRRFGLTIGIAFVGLAAIARWRGSVTASVIFLVVGVTLIAAALLIPRALVPIERVWMGGAAILSKFTTPIFMAIVYFVVFTPAGLIRRVLGKNTLSRADTSESYWVRRDMNARRSDLERQF